MKKTVFIVLVSGLLSACLAPRVQEEKVGLIINEKNMEITSTAFKSGGEIPPKYTCDEADVNPELLINGVPKDAKSLALIVDDPDAPAGTWLHWTLWNLPAGVTTIRENSVPEAAVEGKTDFGRTGWGGPCPPSGEHRYYFRVYALDTELQLPEGATLAELNAAMKDHVLDSGELMGVYSRDK